jgi:protein-L-isoaspartate(D-aspartate) O-methyltransferase
MSGQPPKRADRRGAASFPATSAAPASRPAVAMPQATVHAARQFAARTPATDVRVARAAPSGLGLDSGSVRARMVQQLRARGCRDEAVLQALATVPRHAFVDSALVQQAYEDTSLPIGLGQTISKPSVVARMLELLRQRPGGPVLHRVLEIGTGCGYQAALLALLAKNVISIERLRPLYDRARLNLEPMRPVNLRLVYGDGRVGHAPNAPYDGIVSAAGGDEIPAAWLDQLAPGGRLVAPLIDLRSAQQVLMVIDRHADGRLSRGIHETVRFVPLESGIA